MAHTFYKNDKGKRVPSVTTILGVLDKPALKYWANKIGLEGIRVMEYVDDKAMVGTLAHYIIECHLKNNEPDFKEFDCNKKQIKQAYKCAKKYFEWESYQYDFKPIASELKLVSKTYGYGGTIDFVAILDGKLTLIDFKTCNAIYDEPYYQTAAYANLFEENIIEVKKIALNDFGQTKIEQIVILRIGRDEDEGFEHIEHPAREISFNVFLDCLALYARRKIFEKEMKCAKKIKEAT